ncbi:MAG TPA: DPP IV N-terminal domain-containing protein, partial [Methylomirabilota bacterium]|nr:DPP IV N-terminal domain-containing protein [Methylomirabilota bacterium]
MKPHSPLPVPPGASSVPARGLAVPDPVSPGPRRVAQPVAPLLPWRGDAAVALDRRGTGWLVGAVMGLIMAGLAASADESGLRAAGGGVTKGETIAEEGEWLSPQATGRSGPESPRVFKERIVPHWFGEGGRFWYRNDLRDGAREFVLVDAERGRRDAAFDHARLAAALSKVAGTNWPADRLPFDRIEFTDDLRTVRFAAGGTNWQCDLEAYGCAPMGPAAPAAGGETEGPPDRAQRRGSRSREDEPSDRSPDGRWRAVVREHNLFLVSTDEPARELRLSEDGREGMAYGAISWSPDSRTVIAFRIEPGERKEVYLVESSPRDGGRARLHTRPYPLPGD